MANCTRCLSNGVAREGGPMGLCWKHQNSKCKSCGRLSAGQELCAPCAYEHDLARWRAESLNPLLDTQGNHDLRMAIRQEKLGEAKYHAHRAIEVMFRALYLAAEAVWGNVEPKKSAQEPKQQKKAA